MAKAAPDGQTLGVSIVGPLVINALLFPSMPYDTAKNIAPITILAAQPSVLVATNGLAARMSAGVLALIKQEPDKITYGSIGRGSLSHLAMASLAISAKVNLVHLPFPGSPAAVTALLRGDVQVAVLPAGVRRRTRQGRQAQDAGRDVGQAISRCCRSCRPWARPASPTSRPTPGSA